MSKGYILSIVLLHKGPQAHCETFSFQCHPQDEAVFAADHRKLLVGQQWAEHDNQENWYIEVLCRASFGGGGGGCPALEKYP